MSGSFSGSAIYNELDAHACTWLRNLCTAGAITGGRVVEGDIRDLTPGAVEGKRRFHAFAGIGLWDYALSLAGWPAELPVWTGSCPCQPFSVAGRGKGIADVRHLWPDWFRLIAECRPPIIFGEQVASPAGRTWFDSVSADLEGVGYAVGAADLCAAGLGAPHIRQRLYFVAHLPIGGRHERRALRRWRAERAEATGSGVRSTDDGRDGGDVADLSGARRARRRRPSGPPFQAGLTAQPGRHGDAGELGEPNVQRRPGLDAHLQPGQSRQGVAEVAGPSGADVVGEPDGGGRATRRLRHARVDQQGSSRRSVTDAGGTCDLGDASPPGFSRRPSERGNDESQRAPDERAGDDARDMGDAGGAGGGRDGRAVLGAEGEGSGEREAIGSVAHEFESAGYTRGFWAGADWILCRDGKARPVEPGTFPLVDGRSGRVAVVRPGEQAEETHWYNRTGALKCIGNAIVPQVAAAFIEAALMSINDQLS